MESIDGVPTPGADRSRGVSRHILTVVMETAGKGSVVKGDNIIQRVRNP
jgi:hypothetical protein